MAEWFIALHAHVGIQVTVEADTREEAVAKAQEAAGKKRIPRPDSWTPVVVHNATRYGR